VGIHGLLRETPIEIRKMDSSSPPGSDFLLRFALAKRWGCAQIKYDSSIK
jgi:hypothetical protein